MKKLLLLSILLFSFSVFSQELPNIIPPSPNAFEITKYGDVQINESTGTFAHSIPIYNFSAGKLSLPISLSYIGSGVKVDQLSNWTGINWLLNSGGAITRVVKDKPDEVGIRVFLSYSEVEEKLETDEGITQLINLEQNDTQADQFSFSFANYSGSFYLDENLEPKLASYDKELKIKFIGGVQDIPNQTIEITDPEGIKYYFGGTFGTEQTRLDFTNSNNGGFLPTTAYYLYKIVHPNGDQINLHYIEELDSYNIKLANSESYEAKVVFFNPIPINYFKGTVYNKIIGGKYLSKITSNRDSTKVEFHSRLINNQHINRVLDEIKVVKVEASGNKDIQKFSLSYLSKNSLTNSTRFFLEKIDFFNGLGNKNNGYRFEYNAITDLPDRLSHSKDYLGYYNGKINGSDLPANDHPQLNSAAGVALANREADFEKAIKGSLTRIYYPTGGYSNIEYEAPKIKKKGFLQKQLKVYNRLAEMNPNAHPVPDTKLTDEYIMYEWDDINFPSEDQEVIINISAIAQGNINHAYKIHVTVEDIYDIAESQLQTLILEHDTFSYDKDFIFNFQKDHEYRVAVELELPPQPTNTSPVNVNVSFKYITGVTIENDIGIRVKSVSTNSDGESPMIKRYYYQKINDINDVDKLSYQTNLSAVFISSRSGYEIIDPGQYQIIAKIKIYKLKSDPVFSSYFSKPPVYKNVSISYGGDYFENGGVQKEFRNLGESNGGTILDGAGAASSVNGIQTENANIFDGRTFSEYYIKSFQGGLFLDKKNKYSYAQDISEYLNNLTIQRYFYHPLGAENDVNFDILDGLHIGIFHTYRSKFTMTAQSTYDYTNMVPIADIENADTYNHVRTEQQFEYNTYVDLPSKITSTTSNLNKISETKNYYPDDDDFFDSLDNLEIEDRLAISELKKDNRHILSAPIQIENYVKDTLGNQLSLTFQRTNYGYWGNNIILPRNIQTSKGSNELENRIVYHDYDNKGNPLEVSKADGTSIVYIWGYQQQFPIAKIENAKQLEFTTNQNNRITYAIAASDNDNSDSSEITLRQKLEDVRQAFPDSRVETYTYDPLIGLTSMTDASGYTTYYEYDVFNRLKFIKNKDAKVLKSYDYHYQAEISQYTISSTTNGNGMVSLSATEVDQGQSVTVTVTPNSGYQISSITVNGIVHSISSSFTISNITSNTVVNVQFSVVAVTLVVTPTNLTFMWIDSPLTATVTTSGNWTVSKSASWIIISATSGSGNGSFTIKPSKNNGAVRTGTVTVTQGSTSKVISIIQYDAGGIED